MKTTNLQKAITFLMCFSLLGCGITKEATAKAEKLALHPEPSYTVVNTVNKSFVDVGDYHETTPVNLSGQIYLVTTEIPYGQYAEGSHNQILIIAPNGSKEVVAIDYHFASALVDNGELYVFATKSVAKDIYFFRKINGSWEGQRVIKRSFGESLYNHSVTKAGEWYVMAYETNQSPMIPFSVKFARSKDLVNWEKLPTVYGKHRYTACPTIRFYDGYYYMTYLAIKRGESHEQSVWFTRIARSQDLQTWEESNKTVLWPEGNEGINTSDIDYAELNGATHIYWLVGNQDSWGALRKGTYPGTEKEFLQSFF